MHVRPKPRLPSGRSYDEFDLTYTEPGSTSAEEGLVILDLPNGGAVTMTPILSLQRIEG